MITAAQATEPPEDDRLRVIVATRDTAESAVIAHRFREHLSVGFVRTATSAAEVADAIAAAPFDLLVADRGILEELTVQGGAQLKKVALRDRPSFRLRMPTLRDRTGAFGTVEKPVSEKAVRSVVDAVLHVRDTTRREETERRAREAATERSRQELREIRSFKNPVPVDADEIHDAAALASALRRLADSIGLDHGALERRSARAATVIHNADIRAYLHGTRTPSWERLSSLLLTLGVPPDERWAAALERVAGPDPAAAGATPEPASAPVAPEPVPRQPVPVTRSAFLCHSSGDKEQVRRLYRRLTGDGFACWFDEEDLLPGQDWEWEIQKALRECRYVLVCLSESSINKTGFVQTELRRALDLADRQPEGSIFLIPVRLEECSIPDRLGRLQRVDLFREGDYERLLRVLRGAGGR